MYSVHFQCPMYSILAPLPTYNSTDAPAHGCRATEGDAQLRNQIMMSLEGLPVPDETHSCVD